MKNNNKAVCAFLISLGLISGSVQANPFREAARKWAARGAAVAYWGALASPGIINIHENRKAKNVSADVSQCDSEGKPYLPEFKQYDPKKYAEVQYLYDKNGLKRKLDDYSIRIMTDDGCRRFEKDENIRKKSREYLEWHFGNALALGNNRILLMQNIVDQTKFVTEFCDHEGKCIESEKIHEPLPVASVAGIIAHEVEHNARKHCEKSLLFNSAIPFGLHAITSGVSKMLPSNICKPGSFAYSLLRVPRAGAILGAAHFMKFWYSRKQEKEADASVKECPELARGLAEFFSVKVQSDSTLFEKLTSTHPSHKERNAYLTQWADEAEAKQKKA